MEILGLNAKKFWNFLKNPRDEPQEIPEFLEPI
jgi:hypothetical protein